MYRNKKLAELVKTEICHRYPYCPWADKCWFAHGCGELRKPPVKSVWEREPICEWGDFARRLLMIARGRNLIALGIARQWGNVTRRLLSAVRRRVAAKSKRIVYSPGPKTGYMGVDMKQIRAERRERPKSRQARDKNDPRSKKYLKMLESTPKARRKANRQRDLDTKTQIAALFEIEAPEDVPIESEETPLAENEMYTEEALLELYLQSNTGPRFVYSLDILDFKPPESPEADDIVTSLARDIGNALHNLWQDAVGSLF